MPAPAAAQQEQGAERPKLKITILEGEGAVNNMQQRTARDPVVKITDENDRPVVGAVVTFTLPLRGAGGAFANGARTVSILTNSQGVATAAGLTPNAAAGQFAIQVSTSFQGQVASAAITQVNTATGVAAGGSGAGGGTAGAAGGTGGGLSGTTLGIIVGVAAAAGVGAAVALGGGDKPITRDTCPPTCPTATIRLGGGTVQGGR